MRALALALVLPATLAVTQTITVSGGDRNNAPYYTFDGVNTAPTLVVGTTYEFVDGGVSGSHPFRITGATGRLPITITVEAGVAPEYYCEFHGDMKATFTISDAPPPAAPAPCANMGQWATRTKADDNRCDSHDGVKGGTMAICLSKKVERTDGTWTPCVWVGSECFGDFNDRYGCPPPAPRGRR